MSINGITSNTNLYGMYGSAYSASKTANDEQTVEDAKKSGNDNVDSAASGSAVEYKASGKEKYSVDMEELYKAQNAYVQGLKNMVSQVLSQAGAQKAANGDWSMAGDVRYAVKYSKLLVKGNDGTYTLDPSITGKDRENLINKAKEDVSDDGYFGVKQTSERILNFAKSLSGGDPKKLEELKNAVNRAFEQVSTMFGGNLPDISSKTYDAIMKGFDQLSASASAE